MIEINQTNIAIYTQTLFALARDAWRQGNLKAFDFIVKGYLSGLVPSSALDAFLDELDPNYNTNVRAWTKPDPKGNGNGGALVTNPVPPPRLPPSPTRLTLDDIVKAR